MDIFEEINVELENIWNDIVSNNSLHPFYIDGTTNTIMKIQEKLEIIQSKYEQTSN